MAVFVELPAFDRHRARYLDDGGLRALQDLLMKNPPPRLPIPETGRLRKLRLEGVEGNVENWEQGRARPSAQAALLINLVKRYPGAVDRLATI